MAPVAAVLTFALVAALLWLDRTRARISPAIWVPFLWFGIASSRPVSSWGSSPVSRGESYLDGSPLDRTILMLLILLALGIVWNRRQAAAAIVRSNASIVLFLAYCLVTVLWADYPLVSFKRWMRGVADVLMVLVVLTDTEPEASLQWILTRLGYVLLPMSILFIRFYPELGRAYTVHSGKAMWTGVCTDKNALGLLCTMVGIGILWRWMANGGGRPDRLGGRQWTATGIVFGMIVYLLSIVDSKTALMCFLAAGAAITIRPLFRRPSIVFLYVTGAVAACYAVLIAGVGTGALEAIGRDPTLTGRTDVWEKVLSFATNPLFGAGYENFWIGERLEALEEWGGNQAHNGYLEIYLNLGWIGLFFLAVLILAAYRHVMASFATDPALGRVKVAMFLMCLMYNFSEAGFKMMSPVWLTFLWAAMAPRRKPAVAAAPAPRVLPLTRYAVPIRKPPLHQKA